MKTQNWWKLSNLRRQGGLAWLVCLVVGEALVGWIHNLVVGTAARGHGLGRRLLEHAISHFRTKGMTVAKIETLERNEVGRHLYPSLGFVVQVHRRNLREAKRLIEEAKDAGPAAAVDAERAWEENR